jgi:hypothetical protein
MVNMGEEKFRKPSPTSSRSASSASKPVEEKAGEGQSLKLMN